MTAPGGDPAARIMAALDRLAGDLPALGLAVSGGGDSVALMQVAAEWARGRRVMVATVDHDLRPGSALEAAEVGRAARALGLTHATLRWQRETRSGNLMAQARDARLRLLAGWAQRNDLPAVALGHTADDMAETLLMRLVRSAGIDGLAGMAEWRDAFGMRWLRPALGTQRQELRDWLTARGVSWIDDPSNENPDFERVRIRRAMATLGLDPAPLALAARHIAEARDALCDFAALVARDAQIAQGRLILPRGAFNEAPPEIRRRLLVASCRWITGADYPPRRAPLLAAVEALAAEVWPGEPLGAAALACPRKGQRVVLAVANPAATLDALRAHARAAGVAEIQLPSELRVLAEIPATASGKTDFPRLQGLLEA